MTDFSIIRPDIRESLERYARCEQSYPFGGFLTAVLSGDATAINRADNDNRAAYVEIIMFCTTRLPAESWGTPEKHRAWIARGYEAWQAEQTLAATLIGAFGPRTDEAR